MIITGNTHKIVYECRQTNTSKTVGEYTSLDQAMSALVDAQKLCNRQPGATIDANLLQFVCVSGNIWEWYRIKGM